MTQWAILFLAALWFRWLFLVCFYLILSFWFFTLISIKLTAKSELIHEFVEHLTQAVESYKRRMDWLTSKSRQIFGVVLEQCITIVLDFGGMLAEELHLCHSALTMVLQEQVAHITKFNIIWWVPTGWGYFSETSQIIFIYLALSSMTNIVSSMGREEVLSCNFLEYVIPAKNPQGINLRKLLPALHISGILVFKLEEI